MFGTVFQDFVRYSISVKENVAIGDIDLLNDSDKLEYALKQSKADEFINELPYKENTLLGRDFDGGTDRGIT
jgi:ATP-binding cassette subfamily B protein